MSTQIPRLSVLTLAAGFLAGCGSTSSDLVTGASVSPPTLTLSPSTAFIEVGQTVRLAATVTDADGNRLTITSIEWASSDEGIARMVGSGLVEGEAAGSAVVQASWNGATDQTVIEVRPRRVCQALRANALGPAPCPLP